MATPKNDHWQAVVLTPTGVAAGTYNLANVTVDANGRVVNITSGSSNAVPTAATIAGLPAITPANGLVAVVLDDGSGNEQLYVWNNSNSDLGAPLNRWRLLASTDVSGQPFGFRQDTIATGANQTIDAIIPDNGIIKSVAVEITTAYSGGATITIQDNDGFVYMPSTDINPQLEGLYKIDLSGNLNDIQTNSFAGQGQMRAIIGGAPGAGAAAVYIEFVQP